MGRTKALHALPSATNIPLPPTPSMHFCGFSADSYLLRLFPVLREVLMDRRGLFCHWQPPCAFSIAHMHVHACTCRLY